MWLHFVHFSYHLSPDIPRCFVAQELWSVSLMRKLILQQPHPALGSLALIKRACVYRVWVRVRSVSEKCWHNQIEYHSSYTRRKVIVRPVTCSFSSNLFVPFPCTCACHSWLGIKINEPPVLVFILSAQAVIRTAAARIVVACRWYDWYDVKARGGKFPGVKLMGDSPKWWKWKMKISYFYDREHEQNNTGPPSVYVVTFQQKCAQCLL